MCLHYIGHMAGMFEDPEKMPIEIWKISVISRPDLVSREVYFVLPLLLQILCQSTV